MRALASTILLLSLTACGQSDNDPGPGGVTVGEARALDEAAEMLEDERLGDADISADAQTGEASSNSPPGEPAPGPASTD